MLMRTLLVFVILSASIHAGSLSAQDVGRLFQAEDFTAENLFTNNIEGPAFDHNGDLYVVNFKAGRNNRQGFARW